MAYEVSAVEILLDAIPAILIALGTLYAAAKGLRSVLVESDKEQTEAWVTIRDSFSSRVGDLEEQRASDRARIRALEESEGRLIVETRVSNARIADLEREKFLAIDRLTSLETDHQVLAEDHKKVVASLRTYRNGIKVLLNQMKRLGIDPEWTPPDEEI